MMSGVCFVARSIARLDDRLLMLRVSLGTAKPLAQFHRSTVPPGHGKISYQ